MAARGTFLRISDTYAMDFPDETTVRSSGGNIATRMRETRVEEDFDAPFKKTVRPSSIEGA